MADEEYYSTPEEVIHFTGVKPKDLKFEDDDDDGLEDLIIGWLVQIKNIIDVDRNRNYTDEDDGVPAGIDNIALRMAANQVANALIMRSSPIVQVSEFTLRQVDKDKVLTEAIEKDLHRYPAKLATPLFRLMRVRTIAEIEEDEEDED